MTFTLTTGTDILTLTAGNDTVTGGPVTDGDIILDATTTDADVATLTVGATALTAGSELTLSNVETVTLNMALGADPFNVKKFSGVNVINLDSVAAGQTAATIDGAKSGAVFAIDDTITTLDIDTNGAATAAEAVTLKLAGSNVTLNHASSTTANDIDTLTLNSTTAANTVTLGSNGDFITTTGDTESIAVTGDKSLTIVADQTADATKLDGATVTNALSAGATLTVKLDGATNLENSSIDLSKVAATSFNIADPAAGGGATSIKLASGATVDISADLTNASTIVGSAANSTLNLSASINQSNVALNLNNFSQVNLAVAANRTVGTLALDQTTTLNDAKVSITGAGDLTATKITAKVIDGGTATGKLAFEVGAASTVTTGSAVDTIDTGDLAVTLNTNGGNDLITIGTGKQIINAGAGNDRISFAAANELTDSDAIDGGADTDTLFYTGSDNNVTFATGTFTLSNIEALNFSQITSAAKSATFIGSQLSGKALNVVGGGGLVIVGADAAGTGQSIDLSAINHTGLVANGFQLTGSNNADILKGTLAADSITGGTGADTISGGGGNDYFIIATGNAGQGTARTLTGFVDKDTAMTAAMVAGNTVTGAEVYTDINAGDTIYLGSAATTAAATTVGQVIDQKYTLVKGTYDAGTGVFTAGASLTTGSDLLVAYDSDAASTLEIETIVLVGAASLTVTNALGVLSFA